MARLLGFVANRSDLGARALALEGTAFHVRLHSGGDPGDVASASWGIGFYQGGEILLKRRPFEDRASIEFNEIVKDLKADVLVGHVRTATVGALRTENTHPFRYRQWLFAQTGTVTVAARQRARLIDSLPQFLARDVRGETDAEIVFYLFLSFLHDAGQLDRPDVDAATARQALRSTVALVDSIGAEFDEGPTKLNTIVACGDYLIGLRAAGEMGFEEIAGRTAMERLFSGESFSQTKVPHLTTARILLCASDFDDERVPHGWTRMPDRSMVTLSHNDAPLAEPL